MHASSSKAMLTQNKARDEGTGGAGGIVLPLKLVQTSAEDTAYTIPILVGANPQNLSLQVDTGSSDLWIASTSCSTTPCGQTHGQLYDPTHATQTGDTFLINYLEGNVSGPIVWDQVNLGGYVIPNQALAAADVVQNEPLSDAFVGVLGLALPLNSIIAQTIPPVIDNNPDGAAFPSNLFGISPSSSAPSSRFLSISLERPGSTTIPSLLGIGRHPSELITDPSKIEYSSIVSQSQGDLYWKANVRAITVYIDGQAKPISLGSSASGGPFITATLDTGVPLILTSSLIADGIYGAIGINPASDGQYYLSCTLPLNMSITLDDRSEIPLHPLDLSSEPPQGSSSGNCVGLIQADDPILTDPKSPVGDMILGVPFLRNVYTVMAYDPPDANGSFSNPSPGAPTKRDVNGNAVSPDSGIQTPLNPRLGLLKLTNSTVALQEFHTVRVLHQPLSNSTGAESDPDDGKKLSIGVDVLIGLVGFVVLCFALFAARWLIGKRYWSHRYSSGGLKAWFSAEKSKADTGTGVYRLARRSSRADSLPSEDTLRTMRYEEHLKKERINSEYTVGSARTFVVDHGKAVDDDNASVHDRDLEGNLDENGGFNAGEFGFRRSYRDDAPPALGPVHDTPLEDATLVAIDNIPHAATTSGPPNPLHGREYSPPLPPPNTYPHPYPDHARRQTSLSFPLLSGYASGSDEDLDEFGVVGSGGGRMGMAGVGTAARGGRIDGGMGVGHIRSLTGSGGLDVGGSTSKVGTEGTQIGSGSGVGLGFGSGISASGVDSNSRKSSGAVEDASGAGVESGAGVVPPLLPASSQTSPHRESIPRRLPSGPRPYNSPTRDGTDADLNVDTRHSNAS